MPLSFIRCPDSTKNGTASSGKLWLIVAIFCTPIDIGMPALVMKNTKPEMPMANATGAPRNIRTKKIAVISSMSSELRHDVHLGLRPRIDQRFTVAAVAARP